MSNHNRRGTTRRSVLAGAAAGTALLAAPAIVRAQAQVLKIAVLLPQSGYLAQAGQSCHRGALLAPPQAHVLQLLGAAQELPALAATIANGFDDPRTFFPWWFDAGEAGRLIAAKREQEEALQDQDDSSV